MTRPLHVKWRSTTNRNDFIQTEGVITCFCITTRIIYAVKTDSVHSVGHARLPLYKTIKDVF